MIKRYNCDTQWREMKSEMASLGEDQGFGAMPRQTRFGDAAARKAGLIPFEEISPVTLIDPKDYKEVITDCHAKKIFPIYHKKANWAPPGFRWNQNGLGYCWTWGGTGAFMDTRAREGKESVLLSPVSMGFLVDWRNRGNYLESFIQGARDHGIAPMEYTPDQHSTNYRDFKAGWEEAAYQYRLPPDGVWDTNPSKMIQYAITILSTGTPLYIAYNWWGHALSTCGVIWDESVTNNIIFQNQNSHDEDDVIEMTGSRAIPDEAYGFPATLTPLAA
jgi:hypothetical protein